MKSIRKIFAILLAALFVFSAGSAFAAANMIVINGVPATIPQEMGSIKEIDNRNFVPIRFTSENLGFAVKYGNSTVNGVVQESVTITAPDGTSYFMLNNDNILYVLDSPLSGKSTPPIVMDVKTFIDSAEDRMYIPIRFFAQAVGYTVGWDEETQTVSLSKGE